MSLRVISFNANGIRAASRYGFFEWLQQQDADVICIQETKAQYEQLAADPQFRPTGYHCYYADAEKKGYSGTAIYSRYEPLRVVSGLGWDPADSEGRWLCAEFPGLCIASLYMPSGSSGEHRQKIKFDFMDRFEQDLSNFEQEDREYIICADWNICHREIDLKNWRSNQKNSGFLPEERAWLSKIYETTGWRDGFRLINSEAGHYTWWSQRANARANDVGWRLDYPLLTAGLHSQVRSADIYREPYFSDHAPLVMDYDIELASHANHPQTRGTI